MGAFIVYAENSSFTQAGAPSSAAIEGLFRSIPLIRQRAQHLANGGLDDGNFVGSARITRVTQTLGSDRVTRVGWLYAWPDPPGATPQQLLQRQAVLAPVVKQQLDDALRAADTDWQPVQILQYDPAADGTYEWWSSGQAARTATRDAFDLNQQFGQSSSVDNPVGPTTGRPADLNPFGGPDGALGQASSFVKWTAILLVAGGVLDVAGPLLREGGKAAAGTARRRRRAAGL